MFRLPDGYREDPEPVYFDDAPLAELEIVWQPEVYDVAAILLCNSGRSKVIDIGCGCGRKLSRLVASRRIGIDFGANIAFCRRYHGSAIEWHEADLGNEASGKHADLADADSIIVCADVIEHLRDPRPLLSLLGACHRRRAIVITSTPDRRRLRGADDNGPPYNRAHVREWALDEYVAMLADFDLAPVFAGFTFNNNIELHLTTIVSLHDASVERDGGRGIASAPPLAVLRAGRGFEAVRSTVRDLLGQGCNVAIEPDGLSSDGLDRVRGLDPLRVSLYQGGSFPVGSAPVFTPMSGVPAWCRPDGRWVFRAMAGFAYRTGFPHIALADGFAAAQRHGARLVRFDRAPIPGGMPSLPGQSNAMDGSSPDPAHDDVTGRRNSMSGSDAPPSCQSGAEFCYRFFYSEGCDLTSGSYPDVQAASAIPFDRKLWDNIGFPALVGLARPR